MSIGTEHEYSINDARFSALPVSDRVIKSICGSFESEILFGDVKLGKELQKHVLEFIPRSHADTIPALESQLVQGIQKFYRVFPHGYHLLGLGMHPTLTLDKTAVWDHDEGEYYEVYDRLFDIRQHGWLNIQALQINLSYEGDKDLVAVYNRLRPLLPYLIAVTASSPMVESRLTGAMDNRLIYYRENQQVIPDICHGIVPAAIRTVNDYRSAQEAIYSELKKRDAAILCEEWLNSSGVIVRFSRTCLEIKALDEQECICSDMAVCAFVQALLRCRALFLETDQDALLELTQEVIMHGTAPVQQELKGLYDAAWQKATPEERRYLPVIQNRITKGSLAEQIAKRYREEHEIVPILAGLAHCLRYNEPYGL
ncbi:MAG: glutamate-cysteine ligase family protein [Methanoregula sp.]